MKGLLGAVTSSLWIQGGRGSWVLPGPLEEFHSFSNLPLKVFNQFNLPAIDPAATGSQAHLGQGGENGGVVGYWEAV